MRCPYQSQYLSFLKGVIAIKRIAAVLLTLIVSLLVAPGAVAQESSTPDATAIQNSLLDQMGVPESERPKVEGETPTPPTAQERAKAEREADKPPLKQKKPKKPSKNKPRFRFPFREGKGFLRVKNYEQTQLPWGPRPFCGKPGAPAMSASACGAAVLAMAGSTLTGNFKYTPWYIAQRYCVVHQGSVSWYTRGTDYIVQAAKHMGLTAWPIGLRVRDARQTLEGSDGSLVIMVFGKGRFTNNGHYLLAYRTKGGKFYLKDPYNKGQFGKNNESRPFSGKYLLKQGLYRMWVVKKKRGR